MDEFLQEEKEVPAVPANGQHSVSEWVEWVQNGLNLGATPVQAVVVDVVVVETQESGKKTKKRESAALLLDPEQIDNGSLEANNRPPVIGVEVNPDASFAPIQTAQVQNEDLASSASSSFRAVDRNASISDKAVVEQLLASMTGVHQCMEELLAKRTREPKMEMGHLEPEKRTRSYTSFSEIGDFPDPDPIMLPALVICFTGDEVLPSIDDDWNEGFSIEVLTQILIPSAVVWTIIQLTMRSVPTYIGYQSLSEASSGVDMKDAMENNMTNSGVVLALFFTVLVGMIQVESIQFVAIRNKLWYQILLGFGIESCVRGMVMVSIFLIYHEPLGHSASLHFIVDNMIYVGEPITCMLQTCIYFSLALSVYLFSASGKMIATGVTIVLGYGLIRVLVVMQYLANWESPHVTEEMRKKRESVYEQAWRMDGSSMTEYAAQSGTKSSK